MDEKPKKEPGFWAVQGQQLQEISDTTYNLWVGILGRFLPRAVAGFFARLIALGMVGFTLWFIWALARAWLRRETGY